MGRTGKKVSRGSVVGRIVVIAALVCLLATLCACGGEQASSSAAGAPPSGSQTASTSTESSANASSAGSDTTNVAESTMRQASPALHVEGTRLVDASGNAIQLRGISTHGLAWFPQYVNAELFHELHDDWHANVVRLALYTAESGGYCTDGDRQALRQLVDDGVRFATDAGLYVIIDWHILSDNDPNQHVDEAEAFFRDVSAAYAGRGNVLYEICNEPNGATTWQDVKSYAERIIPVIRENDPDAVVIVGTPTWSQDVDATAADPLAFDNVLYTLHFYAATHTDDLRAKLTGALDAGLPVFVSEFGICDASGNGAIDEAQADAWISLLDERGVSYLMWSLSNKDESSAAIAPGCGKTSGFSDDDLSPAGLWLRDTLA